MESLLPDQYYFSHQYSAWLNEYLVNLLVFGEQSNVYSVSLQPKNQEHDKQLLHLEGEELAAWLEKNGYTDEVEKMTVRTVYQALLADLCQFVAEALSCSARGRLTVAFALLRKPFRDNLFYLEWLLDDPQHFIKTFRDKNPSEFSLDKMLREDKVREIVRRATKKTMKRDSVVSDVIYDIRYNKLVDYSFDPMWNKALHLITTAKTHSTEHRNLNLVFSNDEDRDYQWRHIYAFLPLLLDYAVDVAETLMYMMSGKERPNFYVDYFHRELGFAVWSREVIEWQDDPLVVSEFPNDLDDLHVECPKCHRVIDMRNEWARILFLTRKMKCPKCFRRIGIESIVDKNEIRPHLKMHDVLNHHI
jgi:hypothetical protein